MFANDERSTSVKHALNIVRVDCACVEIFATVVVVPVLADLLYTRFENNFALDNFLEKIPRY